MITRAVIMTFNSDNLKHLATFLASFSCSFLNFLSNRQLLDSVCPALPTDFFAFLICTLFSTSNKICYNYCIFYFEVLNERLCFWLSNGIKTIVVNHHYTELRAKMLMVSPLPRSPLHDLTRISIDCLTPASRLRRSASV